MKIGFIGAGKVCHTMSFYLNSKYNNVVGIYSKDICDAKEAAKFSISEYYSNLSDLLDLCDTLFLTVNDDSLEIIVKELINLNIKNKILIHTSGSYNSDIFSSLNDNNYCYSLHPIYAFNDKYNSINGFGDCYFTLEGNVKYLEDIKKLFLNRVVLINKEDKTKYHIACVMLSNFICGITYKSEEILNSIGINNLEIFRPLILNNINNILNSNSVKALTGPIVRNDIKTISKHLDNIDKKDLYIMLSNILIEMSMKKTDNDYSEMKKLLGGIK